MFIVFIFPFFVSYTLLSSSLFFLFSEPLLIPPHRSYPLSPAPPPAPLSAGVLCNWAVVNSTLAWISSIATFGWRC